MMIITLTTPMNMQSGVYTAGLKDF